MAYTLLKNGQTEFAVDWDVVDRLVRGYWAAETRVLYSEKTRTSQSTWYNPATWSLPDIVQIDVDWDRVRAQTKLRAEADSARFRRDGKTNMASVAYELAYMVDRTGKQTESFVDKLGDAQTENTRAFDRAIESYETQIGIAKFFRDTSASGLMVGATLLSGGAAAAALGGGSLMTGWAKFQDTDNVGAAVLTGIGTFTFAAIPMGKELVGGQKYALVVVQSTWEAGIALTEGKSLAEAIPTGALTLAGPGVEKIFGTAPVQKLLRTAAIPLNITVSKKVIEELTPRLFTMWEETRVTEKLLGDWGAQIVQKQVVDRYGGAGITAVVGPDSKTAKSDPPPPRQSVVREATFKNEILLKLAVVNMEKGIGHGW